METVNTNQKLRVLWLYGYYNNIQFMKHQMNYYEQIFNDYMEFVYIDAPIEVKSVYDPVLFQRYEAPFYAWANFDVNSKKLINWIESLNWVIDYINENGPFDGVIGFSQGTLIWRLLMKNKDLLKYSPELISPIKFAILIAPLSYHRLNPFEEREDYNILYNQYEQPIYYLYGSEDPFYETITEWVVHKGEYVVEIHNESHKIPKLITPNIDSLILFIAKQYKAKYNIPLKINFEIDQDYRNNYMKSQSIPKRSKI